MSFLNIFFINKPTSTRLSYSTREPRGRRCGTRRGLFPSFRLLKLHQNEDQIGRIQHKIEWRESDDVAFGARHAGFHALRVAESIQAQADHVVGSQRVQKQIAK